MTVRSLLAANPMKKDASCINILTCEQHIKSLLPQVPYRKLFDGIVGSRKFFVTDENTGRLIPVSTNYL
ncbi:MAG: hypothetical protein PVF37_14495, partial [Desulfobacterales bacterium]